MSFDRLGLRPSSFAPSRTRATPSPPRSRPSRHPPWSSPAATCSPAPRPAPARPLPSCCRSCSASHATRPPQPATAATPVAATIRVLVLDTDPRARPPGGGERPHLRRPRPVRSVAIYGGVGFGPQVERASAPGPGRRRDPGRLLDHVGQRTIDLSRVEILVLDEADRMLDMGFIRDIRRILALLPARRQNLLFSATFSADIRELADWPAARAGRGATSRRATPPPSWSGRSSTRSTASASASCSATSCAAGASTRPSSSPGPSTVPTGSPSSSRRDGIATAAIHGNKSQAAASPRAGRLQGRASDGARGDRHRRPRPRHRRTAARRQLRAADGRPGLRASHRSDRPGRRRGRGDLARLRRRDAAAAGHRATPAAPDPVRGRRRGSSRIARSVRSRFAYARPSIAPGRREPGGLPRPSARRRDDRPARRIHRPADPGRRPADRERIAGRDAALRAEPRPGAPDPCAVRARGRLRPPGHQPTRRASRRAVRPTCPGSRRRPAPLLRCPGPAVGGAGARGRRLRLRRRRSGADRRERCPPTAGSCSRGRRPSAPGSGSP